MSSTFGHSAAGSPIFGQSHSRRGRDASSRAFPPASFTSTSRPSPPSWRAARQAATPWATPRKEPDEPRIVSGLNPDGRTCGAPLAAVDRATPTRARSDYSDLRRRAAPGPRRPSPRGPRWHGEQDVRGRRALLGPAHRAPLRSRCGDSPAVSSACRGVRVRRPSSPSVAGIPAALLGARQLACLARPARDAQTAALGDAKRIAVLVDEARARAWSDGRRWTRGAAQGLGRRRRRVRCATGHARRGGRLRCSTASRTVIARALFGIPAVKGARVRRAASRVARLSGSAGQRPLRLGSDGRRLRRRDQQRRRHPRRHHDGHAPGARALRLQAHLQRSCVEQDSVDLTTMEPARARACTARARHHGVVMRAVPVRRGGLRPARRARETASLATWTRRAETLDAGDQARRFRTMPPEPLMNFARRDQTAFDEELFRLCLGARRRGRGHRVRGPIKREHRHARLSIPRRERRQGRGTPR